MIFLRHIHSGRRQRFLSILGAMAVAILLAFPGEGIINGGAKAETPGEGKSLPRESKDASHVAMQKEHGTSSPRRAHHKSMRFNFATYDGTGGYRDGKEIPALYCMFTPGFGRKGPWKRISGPTPKSGWRHGGVTWGFPVRIDGTIYVYAEGYPNNGNDGTGCGVGVFESSDNGQTWKEYARNPIFPAHFDGMDPGPGVPYIIYDPADPNPNRRFKMYMANHGASFSTYSVVAFSPNGLPDSWEMYTGRNGRPVHVISISGSDSQITPYCVVQDGTTLKMFCQAYNKTRGFYTVEFTSAAGNGIHWTRQPASFLPKRNSSVTTADAKEGSQILHVADAAAFTIGEIVAYAGDDYLEINRVAAINASANKIMLQRPVMKTDLASGSKIYSVAFNCVFPTSLYRIGEFWFGFADCLGSIGKYTFDFCIPISGVTPETLRYDWLQGWPLDPMQHTDEHSGDISPIPIDEALRYIMIDR